MTLVLLRHAEAGAEARGRCYGALDVALTARGRRQAATLARLFTDEPLGAVVSSPSRRAVVTARAIARPHGHAVDVLDGLRELDFGAFEGRTHDELAREHPELYGRWMSEPTRVRFPGGESWVDLRERAVSAVELLRERSERTRVLAVTHAGVVRTVVAELLGMRAEHVFRLAIPPASATFVDWVDGEPLVGPVGVSLARIEPHGFVRD